MFGRRLSWGIRCVFVALLMATSAAQAQVDWSDLFPEEGGKPAAKAPRDSQHVQPVPAPVHRGPVARPQTAPVPVQRVAAPKPRGKANPPQQQYDRDREFPAVPEVSMPQFDR